MKLPLSFLILCLGIQLFGQAPLSEVPNSPLQKKQLSSTKEDSVLTSLGISRSRMSLPYAMQSVDVSPLSQARELNVINSLSGKVAGISILRSGSGLASPSRLTLRGNRSFSGNNQALVLVDGIPSIGNLMHLNPDDISSIEVLKGPNAAAIYGNRAQNGAILIQTKQGSEGFSVQVNSSLMVDIPILLLPFQNTYGQGSRGTYREGAERSWGPEMTGQEVQHWSPDPNFPEDTYPYQAQFPTESFFQRGMSQSNHLAISGGNNRTHSYFSYGFTQASGIVPNNRLQRHNIHLQVSNQIHKRLRLQSKVTYVRQDIDNRLVEGADYDNPLRHLYRLPRNIRPQDMQNFEYIDEEGYTRQHFWRPGSNGGANPYWTINRNLNHHTDDRLMGFGSLDWQVSRGLTIQLRSGIDKLSSTYEKKYYQDSYIIADNGLFEIGQSDAWEWNSDLLISYHKRVSQDLSLDVWAGGNIRKEQVSQHMSNTGAGLLLSNVFTLSNSRQVASFQEVGRQRAVHSLYGIGHIAWKNQIFLDVSLRNDWSSALAPGQVSYLYPSIGTSILLSEWMSLPETIDLLRLRASWASVGNDVRPFQTQQVFNSVPGGNAGFLEPGTILPPVNLLPESSTSVELGTEIGLLDNRISMDLSVYQIHTRNQLFSIPIPIAAGGTEKYINGGLVRNRGIEAVLHLIPIQRKQWRWQVSMNLSRYRNQVIEIHEDRSMIRGPYVQGSFFTLEEGQPWGQVYPSFAVDRDGQGRAHILSNGSLDLTAEVSQSIGSFHPDWLGGIQNSFSIFDFSLNFLIDIRQGGQVFSATKQMMASTGVLEETLRGREGGLIYGINLFPEETAILEDGSINNIDITAEDFWVNVGGCCAPVGEFFVLDASNIRLREFVLAYQPEFKNPRLIKAFEISLVGRNLFFLRNRAGIIDPEVFVGTDMSSEGMESFSPPTARSMGLNVSLEF